MLARLRRPLVSLLRNPYRLASSHHILGEESLRMLMENGPHNVLPDSACAFLLKDITARLEDTEMTMRHASYILTNLPYVNASTQITLFGIVFERLKDFRRDEPFDFKNVQHMFNYLPLLYTAASTSQFLPAELRQSLLGYFVVPTLQSIFAAIDRDRVPVGINCAAQLFLAQRICDAALTPDFNPSVMSDDAQYALGLFDYFLDEVWRRVLVETHPSQYVPEAVKRLHGRSFVSALEIESVIEQGSLDSLVFALVNDDHVPSPISAPLYDKIADLLHLQPGHSVHQPAPALGALLAARALHVGPLAPWVDLSPEITRKQPYRGAHTPDAPLHPNLLTACRFDDVLGARLAKALGGMARFWEPRPAQLEKTLFSGVKYAQSKVISARPLTARERIILSNDHVQIPESARWEDPHTTRAFDNLKVEMRAHWPWGGMARQAWAWAQEAIATSGLPLSPFLDEVDGELVPTAVARSLEMVLAKSPDRKLPPSASNLTMSVPVAVATRAAARDVSLKMGGLSAKVQAKREGQEGAFITGMRASLSRAVKVARPGASPLDWSQQFEWYRTNSRDFRGEALTDRSVQTAQDRVRDKAIEFMKARQDYAGAIIIPPASSPLYRPARDPLAGLTYSRSDGTVVDVAKYNQELCRAAKKTAWAQAKVDLRSRLMAAGVPESAAQIPVTSWEEAPLFEAQREMVDELLNEDRLREASVMSAAERALQERLAGNRKQPAPKPGVLSDEVLKVVGGWSDGRDEWGRAVTREGDKPPAEEGDAELKERLRLVTAGTREFSFWNAAA